MDIYIYIYLYIYIYIYIYMCVCVSVYVTKEKLNIIQDKVRRGTKKNDTHGDYN